MKMWIVVVVCLVAVVAAFAFGRMYPSKDIVGELTEQIRLETVRAYAARLTELDRQLKISQAAYLESQKRYENIIKKIEELNHAKESVEKPADRDELVARLDALGYPPSR